jgi:hypothetical protein
LNTKSLPEKAGFFLFKGLSDSGCFRRLFRFRRFALAAFAFTGTVLTLFFFFTAGRTHPVPGTVVSDVKTLPLKHHANRIDNPANLSRTQGTFG